MSMKRRSSNATESTSEIRKDRSITESKPEPATSTESRTTTPSTSEETNPVTDKTAGRLPREDKKAVTSENFRDPKEVLKEMKTKISEKVVESSTKATAIVKELVTEHAICPSCHEKRYKPEQVGTTVVCINCRASVVLR